MRLGLAFVLMAMSSTAAMGAELIVRPGPFFVCDTAEKFVGVMTYVLYGRKDPLPSGCYKAPAGSTAKIVKCIGAQRHICEFTFTKPITGEVRSAWAGRDLVAPASDEIERQLVLRVQRNNGVIDNSVFQAGLQTGLPVDAVVRMINLFAYDVDFKHDVQKGDTFETLIEQHRDRNGDVVRYGNILYASMTIQGSTIKLYRWQGDDGQVDYFTEKGESSRKVLVRSPSDRAHLVGDELARYLKMVKTIEMRWQALARNGASSNYTILGGDQEVDTGCVNSIRLDPTDKRPCE